MIRCSACGRENADRVLRCLECGGQLPGALACPACGALSARGNRFCGQCGGALVAAGAQDAPPDGPFGVAAGESGVPGERKQVTVLFADVKGSMDLSGAVEVEQWWSIMRRFFQLLSEGVHRFEGRVDRFTGDGVMAIFGAPTSLEDHARRACHAALLLQRSLATYAEELRSERAPSLEVRIGLNSGEVVVGTIGDDVSSEYTAIGHTAGLAQRMEALAEPGCIYMTESTARLVRGFFVTHERGAMRVKGVDAPLKVFELVRADLDRSQFELSMIRGLSRFVGRGHELQALQGALASTLAGETRAVGVTGAAGVGKSRLCHEFLRETQQRGVPVWRAHAFAHTRRVAFLPALELLRDYFGIAAEDGAQDARERVVSLLASLGEDLGDALALVLEFLGIAADARDPLPVGAEARQRRLVAAITRIVRARSRATPGVIFVEDLHWIDEGSASLLASLLAAVRGTQTLMLCTYRPEGAPAWMRGGHVSTVPLASLGAEETLSLSESLLGADPSLDGLGEMLHRHSGGNPFFIEEIVKALAEAGVLEGPGGAYRLTRTIDDVVIPDHVHTVLAARIDRLDERAKETLQAAAVIGREFSEPVLRRVAGLPDKVIADSLRTLLDAELVLPAEDGAYLFKHSLAERVAYRSQLAKRRERSHAAAAKAIAEVSPERLDELAGLIAHHWEHAGEPIEAARWCMRAAGWAGFNDPNEALRQWGRARELADAAPAGAERDELALGARVMLLNLSWRQGVPKSKTREQFERETAQLYEEAKALAELAGNSVAQTISAAAYGAVRGLSGHLEDMAGLGMEAIALAQRAGDRSLKLSILPGPVYGLYALGRYREVLDVLERATRELPEDPASVGGVTMVCPYAWILCWQAAARAHCGNLDAAFAGFDRALSLARERGDFETESWSLMSLVQAMQLAGGGDGLPAALHAQEIAERTGGAFSLGLAWRYRGIAHLLREEWGQAIESLDLALRTWRAHRVGLEAEPHALTMLARARLGAADAEGAALSASEAVSLAAARHTGGHEIEARLALVAALRTLNGAEAAPLLREHLARAEALVHSSGARTLAPRIHAERAKLAQLLHDGHTCARELELALAGFREVGAPILAERLENAGAGERLPSRGPA